MDIQTRYSKGCTQDDPGSWREHVDLWRLEGYWGLKESQPRILCHRPSGGDGVELMGISGRTIETASADSRSRYEDETILGGWDVSRHTPTSLRRWLSEQHVQFMQQLHRPIR